jgi:hypothetical protein
VIVVAQCEMTDLKEQRICIVFHVYLDKAAFETYEMLRKAFCDGAMCRTQTFQWNLHFKSGQTSVEGFVCSYHPL